MTDGEALRRAVVANPDDDVPRLIYADWLDENRQPDRAAFIRAQVESVRAEPFGVQARSAATRAEQLLKLHHDGWTRHLPAGIINRELPRFERGFVGHLTIEPAGFVGVVDAIFATEPVQGLRLVRSLDVNEAVSLLPIFELPQLRHVRRLELTSQLGFTYEEYASLTASAHLSGLQELSLRGSQVQPPWLLETLAGHAFPKLVGLDVADVTNLGPRLTEALTRADHRELRRLDVSGVRFTSDELQRLLTSRCLRRIVELRLGWLGRPGEVGPLFHLEFGWLIPWERLVVLDLAGQHLGDEGVRAITIRREAAALRWLGLSNNALGRESVRLLVASQHLALNHLDVRGNGLKHNDVAALQRRFPNAHVVS